jgi:hypothetical protein
LNNAISSIQIPAEAFISRGLHLVPLFGLQSHHFYIFLTTSNTTMDLQLLDELEDDLVEDIIILGECGLCLRSVQGAGWGCGNGALLG